MAITTWFDSFLNYQLIIILIGLGSIPAAAVVLLTKYEMNLTDEIIKIESEMNGSDHTAAVEKDSGVVVEQRSIYRYVDIYLYLHNIIRIKNK